jgi:hypothetical protein
MEKLLPLPTSINLEGLRENLDFIVASMSAYMCDCLVVCLTEENHNTGSTLNVETEDKNHRFRLEWATKMTPHLVGATRDEERTTEWAAMGIALLLVRELMDYPYIYTRSKGEGIDFCLSKDENLSCDARLEVSGIRKVTLTNTLEKRLRIKKLQTERSHDYDGPIFISITEFSTPKSLFIKK